MKVTTTSPSRPIFTTATSSLRPAPVSAMTGIAFDSGSDFSAYKMKGECESWATNSDDEDTIDWIFTADEFDHVSLSSTPSPSPPKETDLDILSRDHLLMCLSYCNARDLCVLAQVSKTFQTLCSSEALWLPFLNILTQELRVSVQLSKWADDAKYCFLRISDACNFIKLPSNPDENDKMITQRRRKRTLGYELIELTRGKRIRKAVALKRNNSWRQFPESETRDAGVWPQ